MAGPSEIFFKLVHQLQQYRRKIDPVLDGVERARLLLDRLEQIEQTGPKIRQARLMLDAVDDALNGINRKLEMPRLSVSQLAQIAGSLPPEEVKRLIEVLSETGS